MRESLSFPKAAPERRSKLNPFESTPPFDGELAEIEKQDIDVALSALEAACLHSENEGARASRREAEGIVLAYGPRAKQYLEEKRREGKLHEDDYSFFESSWWNEAYSDERDPFYEMYQDPFSQKSFDGDPLYGMSRFEQDLAAQSEAAYQETLAMVRLLELATRMQKGPTRRHQEESESYQFFRWPESQKELYQFCKAIADYLKDQEIPNLIIMDRSSRPLYIGVREYWKSRFPDTKMPNMYFMNPKGFKTRESLSPEEIAEIIEECEWKDDAIEAANRVRTKNEILEEIKDTYTQLMKEKDKPVLIFDTCLHTGRTLKPVRDLLIERGFSDLRIGSVNPADPGSYVQTDFYITRRHAEKGCYPFDKDRLVEKTFDHVYSKRATDSLKRESSRQLRNEIRKIIREQLAANSE